MTFQIKNISPPVSTNPSIGNTNLQKISVSLVEVPVYAGYVKKTPWLIKIATETNRKRATPTSKTHIHQLFADTRCRIKDLLR